MSGPKQSVWEIEREMREALRRERRRQQIDEIENEISVLERELRRLESRYGELAKQTVVRVQGWLADVQRAINGDLREAWRGIKGARNYLSKQQRWMEEKQRKQEARRQERERREAEKNRKVEEALQAILAIQEELDALREEYGTKAEPVLARPMEWIDEALREANVHPDRAMKSVSGIRKYIDSKQPEFKRIGQEMEKERKIEALIDELNEMRSEYAEIMNQGIEQRLELFSKALHVNPDNPRTLEQVEQFRKQLDELKEAEEEKREERRYVEKVFSEALGSDFHEDGSGNVTLAGEINGVPIKVTLHEESQRIDLDTPTDGSCREALHHMLDRLQGAGVELGPIRVLNTGEVMTEHSRITRGFDRTRIKA